MQLAAELQSRGLLKQVTDNDLDAKLAALADAGPIACYAGFDPTADCLHVGNYVPIRGLMSAQRHGIQPIAVVGGATGLVGDPSGKDAERQFLTMDKVAANTKGIRSVLERFLDFDHPTAPATIVNNLDWFGPMLAIDFLRNIGKHFRVGPMLGKESVRARMSASDEGISFTEFSYQLLQGYDFYRLYKDHRCVLQIGGSDQWGNITAGIDLTRKLEGEASNVFGLTMPFISSSSGVPFSKSKGNAPWLSADRTDPYSFYQFWLRVEDADAGRYLRLFTFVPLEEIEQLEQSHETRACQKRLAQEMTRLTHGHGSLQGAEAAADIMFGGVIHQGIDDDTLAQVFDQVPTVKVQRGQLTAGWPAIDAAVHAGVAKSKGDARRLITQGGFYINNIARTDLDQPLTLDDLVTPTAIVLRGGKKNYRLVRVE